MLVITKIHNLSPLSSIILRFFVIVKYFFGGTNSMYRCKDCGRNFDYPQKIKEKDDEMLTISRVYFVCPECGSDNITENIIRYCKCCGRSLGTNKKDYCSIVCRKQGEKLYEQQRKKYIHIKSSPIYETARLLDKYNKEHNTKLSYGQFTACVMPKLLKEEKKNGKVGRKNEVS